MAEAPAMQPGEDPGDPNAAPVEEPAPDGQGVPQDGSEELPPEEQSLQPEEPEEDDDYAGPDDDQVVGDQRTLQVSCQSKDFDGVMVPLGDAWQADDGELHGSGLPAVMLFEPSSKQRYRNASLGLDVSPLTILAKRLSRCTLLRTVVVEGDDE